MRSRTTVSGAPATVPAASATVACRPWASAAPTTDSVSRSAAKEIAPDAGKGSTWQWQSHLLFLPFHGTMTREDYVPHERIVDRSSTGVLWTFTLEPDDAGTTLTMEVEVSSSVPFLDKIEDKVFWKGDQDLDTWLGRYKEAIEA